MAKSFAILLWGKLQFLAVVLLWALKPAQGQFLSGLYCDSAGLSLFSQGQALHLRRINPIKEKLPTQ